MTAKQEDKLTMWTATSAVLSKNEDTAKKVPAYYDAMMTFRKINSELQPHTALQSTPITGVTVDKSELREEVVKKASQIALNIKSYASKTKNNDLKKQFTFAPSHFDKLRDNTFPIIIGNILSKASLLVNELERYGVTPEKIEKLRAALENYNGKNPGPRLATGGRKQATIIIAAKIKEGEAELDLMDDLIGNFLEENAAFVAAYQNARIIIPTGGGSSPKNPTPPPGKE